MRPIHSKLRVAAVGILISQLTSNPYVSACLRIYLFEQVTKNTMFHLSISFQHTTLTIAFHMNMFMK